MHRPVPRLESRLVALAAVALLGAGLAGAAGGCSGQEALSGSGYTSVAESGTPAAAGEATTASQQPNAASGPNVQPADAADANVAPADATSGANPNAAVAAGGNVRALNVGNGFGLLSTATNKCLASADANPVAGSTLVLASCANSNAQAFAYLKGQLALMRSLCITSNGVGNRLTLTPCQTYANQIWELNGVTHALTHTMADAPSERVVVMDGAQNVTAQTSGNGTALALFPVTLAGTDGMRVHARTVADDDLCLADVDGTLTMQDCASQTDAQVWDFSNNQLMSVRGRRCLTGDTSQRTVAMASCASTIAASQSWYIMDYFLSLMAPSTTNDAGSLVLVLNGSNFPVLANSSGSQVRFALGAPAPQP